MTDRSAEALDTADEPRAKADRLWLRTLEGFALTYKGSWRSQLGASFLNPILFLLAMGVGLGQLVNKGHQTGAHASLPHGVGYLTFLAPGLLAASALQSAAIECTFPVMDGIKWRKSYYATLATPVDVRSLCLGQQAWVALRLLMMSTVFLAVMACFGVVKSGWAVVAIPAAVLTGLSFSSPLSAFTAFIEKQHVLPGVMRFVVLPMFLFSGTFFPVAQLPAVIRPIAYALPLWHGVQLCRDLVLGTAALGPSVSHAAYLGAWFLVGLAVQVVSFRRRLVV